MRVDSDWMRLADGPGLVPSFYFWHQCSMYLLCCEVVWKSISIHFCLSLQGAVMWTLMISVSSSAPGWLQKQLTWWDWASCALPSNRWEVGSSKLQRLQLQTSICGVMTEQLTDSQQSVSYRRKQTCLDGRFYVFYFQRYFKKNRSNHLRHVSDIYKIFIISN